jgi:hypothetical protein
MDSITQEQTLITYIFPGKREGGRGLMQVEGAYIAETLNLVEYVESKEDPLITIEGHTNITQSQHCYK